MKKKVLIVVHQLNHGGVQKALLTALDALDYDKNDVTLYIRKNRTQFLGEVNKKVSKIIVNEDNTHYYRKPYSIVCLLQIYILKMLKAEKRVEQVTEKLQQYLLKCKMGYEQKKYFGNTECYDVAISYVQGYNAQFVAQYINAKRKVMFYHESVDQKHELHEQIMGKFDTIVGVNCGVQQMLAETYPQYANKMIFIDNYIEPKGLLEKAKEKEIPKVKHKGLTLCSCGRFVDVKGFDLAVEAAHYLKQKGILFIWYFVGDGPNRQALEKQIQECGLEDDIILTGMQDNPYPWIDGCDVYVQASYAEAHPLAIMEAFILCKPVVTTRTTGGKRLVKHNVNGVVVDIDSVSIAEGIAYLYQKQETYAGMIQYLKEIDYSKEKTEYRKKWGALLEG